MLLFIYFLLDIVDIAAGEELAAQFSYSTGGFSVKPRRAEKAIRHQMSVIS